MQIISGNGIQCAQQYYPMRKSIAWASSTIPSQTCDHKGQRLFAQKRTKGIDLSFCQRYKHAIAFGSPQGPEPVTGTRLDDEGGKLVNSRGEISMIKTLLHDTADQQGIPFRTLAQVQDAMTEAGKRGAGDAMAQLLMKHGRITPEAYRFLESFIEECPKCGLLNGHRFPCVF